MFSFSGDISSKVYTQQIFLLKTIGEKIQKELGKLDEALDKHTFIELFWDCWIERFERNDLRGNYIELIILNLCIGTMITDMYLLARVFMDYDMSESKKIEDVHINHIIKISLFMVEALISPLYEYKSKNPLSHPSPKSIEFNEPLQFF